MVYPPTINGQRVNTLQLFGGGEYLLVLWHALGQHEAGGVPLPIFEVLQVAAAYGSPYAPGCGGLVYLEILGHGLDRRVLLAPTVYDVIDGLYGLADGLRYRRLHALGYQAGDEIADAGVVGERGNDAAAARPSRALPGEGWRGP